MLRNMISKIQCIYNRNMNIIDRRNAKVGVIMNKPSITKEQIVKSSEASKRFGQIRKKAKDTPLYITDNGNIDSVILGYEYFEKMYGRLIELEEKEESRILSKRMSELEENPSSAVSWRDVRRTR